VFNRGFISLSELGKIFHLFSNNIDCKILMQGEMRFEKSFKSYLNNNWLWCWEQTWFDKASKNWWSINQNILHKWIIITLKTGH
jgi:hypothetical protein